ncbi:hypothetical protein BLOT_016682 [Blomia tropicalis]|nr:hypothetical protein BLOT_016682 [Blomia tropicalis]
MILDENQKQINRIPKCKSLRFKVDIASLLCNGLNNECSIQIRYQLRYVRDLNYATTTISLH